MEDIYAAHSGGIEPLLVVAMSIDPLRSWNLTDFPSMSHQTQRREAPIGQHGDCAGQQQQNETITNARLYKRTRQHCDSPGGGMIAFPQGSSAPGKHLAGSS